MLTKKFALFVLAGITLATVGCKKVEGEGGAASIIGTLNAQKKNAVGNIVSEYPLAKEDIYIVYGEDGSYFDDRIESSYDGTFEFRNLQPGKYTVFLYEDCNSCASGKQEIIKQVEIAGKKEVVDLSIINVTQ